MTRSVFRSVVGRQLHPVGRVALLFGLVLPVTPATAQVPLTPDGFTNQVAAAINADRPDMPVRVTAPLTLEGRTATGQSVQMNLDRIYASCRADQVRCPGILAAYVGQAGTILRQDAVAPAQAGLRLAVRPQGYVQGLATTAGGPVPASSRFLPPGLLALVYMDTPASMRLMTSRDLQAMHVGEGQVFATALQNTERALQPLDQVAKALPRAKSAGSGAQPTSRAAFCSRLIGAGWRRNWAATFSLPCHRPRKCSTPTVRGLGLFLAFQPWRVHVLPKLNGPRRQPSSSGTKMDGVLPPHKSAPHADKRLRRSMHKPTIANVVGRSTTCR